MTQRSYKPYQLKVSRVTFYLVAVLAMLLAACSQPPVPDAQAPEQTLDATAVTYRWKNVEIGGGGLVSGLVVHPKVPDVVYARTDVGGAFRWSAATQAWTSITDQFTGNQSGYNAVESIAIDPNNANIVYAMVGDCVAGQERDVNCLRKTAIIKSTNRGDTWTVLRSSLFISGNGDFRELGERLMVDPNNSNIVYAGTRLSGLLISENAGQTWTRINTVPVGGNPDLFALGCTAQGEVPGVAWVAIDPRTTAGGRSSTVYVGVAKYGIYRKNADNTWQRISPAGVNPRIPAKGVVASDGTLYTAYIGSFGSYYQPFNPVKFEDPYDPCFPRRQTAQLVPAVYKYKNLAWTNISPPTTNSSWNALAVDPKNPNIVAVAPVNSGADYWGVQVTRNGGQSWQEQTFNTKFFRPKEDWLTNDKVNLTNALAFNPFKAGQVWGTSGFTVWRTENFVPDAGQTVWTTQAKGIAETVDKLTVSRPGIAGVFTVIADLCAFNYTNIDVTPKEAQRVRVPIPSTCVDLKFSEKSPNNLFIIGGSSNDNGSDRVRLRSTDGGLTWQPFNDIPSGDGNAGRIAVSATNPNVLIWAPAGEPVYYSNNGGQSWQQSTRPSNDNIDLRPTFRGSIYTNEQPVVADKVNGKFYIYGNRVPFSNTFRPFVYRSDDGGKSWLIANNGDVFGGSFEGDVHLRTVFGQAGHVWAALPTKGLWRSSNEAQTFTQVAGFSKAVSVSFGKTATGASYPTIFVLGQRASVSSVWRSVDNGVTWENVAPAIQQRVLTARGVSLEADRNVFGRVYVSTSGRGTFYGQPQ
jgi:xyloglucan-specific exo-beta-1,4-glucanase